MTEEPKPIWSKRLGYLIQEGFDFLGQWNSYQRANVVVRAVPQTEGDHLVIYRYGVRGVLVPDEAVEQLRDILGRARSLMDIAMFTAVTAAASPPLTAQQERNTYFPISATEDAWNSAAGQPHLKALPQAKRDALRAMQPFVTGDPVATWFQEIHNKDKHQRPLELSVIPDPLWPMIFPHLVPNPKTTSGDYSFDLVDPLPAVAQRVDFLTYRSVDLIKSAGIEDVGIALAVWVDNEWRDIQHMLWDVMEFTARACAVLDDGDVELADSMKAYFDAERRQLDAFGKLLTQGDEEWLELTADRRQRGAAFERVLKRDAGDVRPIARLHD